MVCGDDGIGFAREVFDEMGERNVVSWNSLLAGYIRCGDVDMARRVFDEMPERNVVSWTTMVAGFARNGKCKQALSYFNQMRRARVELDQVALLAALSACAELGFLDEAFELIKTMPVKPNDAVCGALLGGCQIHKNADLASQVAEKLVAELDPNHAAGYLVLLSNVYATAKRWQDVANVRQKMIEMGVKKPVGRSWVQIDGAVQYFISGDNTNKHASSIYDMLWQVTRQAKQEGYEPDTSEIISNME
ncbi:hypothetical protein CCACVL1_02685 [Corchorus capsularis]|uniref:Pentatricopeptide repeat-containing protein n=1 Tax=Corchorus capsularis TaxID=210143 RepID=A0A1R3K6Z2_COCAP|nr:hypothetical protein CCACVL1_02685 [Corchorus capsularis]